MRFRDYEDSLDPDPYSIAYLILACVAATGSILSPTLVIYFERRREYREMERRRRIILESIISLKDLVSRIEYMAGRLSSLAISVGVKEFNPFTAAFVSGYPARETGRMKRELQRIMRRADKLVENILINVYEQEIYHKFRSQREKLLEDFKSAINSKDYDEFKQHTIRMISILKEIYDELERIYR